MTEREDEDDGAPATINMMSGGTQGSDYQQQIDDLERREKYEVMMDEADERGSPATINMMSNGGADYQRQLDAIDDTYVPSQPSLDIISEEEEREEHARRERYGQATEAHEELLRSHETKTLEDASLSPAEIKRESGYNVFGSLISGQAVSKSSLKDAGLSKKESLAEMRPLGDSDWSYSSWGSKKPIAIKEGKAQVDPFVDLKTYYDPPTMTNAKGKKSLSPLMRTSFSAFAGDVDGYAGLSFGDDGRTSIPYIGGLGIGAGIDATGYDFSGIHGKTIRTTKDPIGQIQKTKRRMASTEILTKGLFGLDYKTKKWKQDSSSVVKRKKSEPAGSMFGLNMGVGGGLGTAFAFVRKPLKPKQSMISTFKNQPSPFNWAERAGVDYNGNFVDGALGNLFAPIGKTKGNDKNEPRGNVNPVADPAINKDPWGGIKSFIEKENEDTTPGNNKKYANVKYDKNGNPVGAKASRTVGNMKKSTPEAYTGFTPLRILPVGASSNVKRKYNKNLKAYNAGDSEREAESESALLKAGYSEKDPTKFLNRPIVHFDPDYLKNKNKPPKSVHGEAQDVPLNVREFLGFTPTQKINKGMLESAWAPHIKAEQSKQSEEAAIEADTFFKFETMIGKKASAYATATKDRQALEDYAASWKRKGEAHQASKKKADAEAAEKSEKASYLSELAYTYEAEDKVAADTKFITDWRAKRATYKHRAQKADLDEVFKEIKSDRDSAHRFRVKSYTGELQDKLKEMKRSNKARSDYYANESPVTIWKDELLKNKQTGSGYWSGVVAGLGGGLEPWNKKYNEEKERKMFMDANPDKAAKIKFYENAKAGTLGIITRGYNDLTAGQRARGAAAQDQHGFLYAGGRQPTTKGLYPRPMRRPANAMRGAPEMMSMFGGGGGSRQSMFGMPKRAYAMKRTKSSGKLVLTASARKQMAADKRREQKMYSKKKKSGSLGFMDSLFGGF
jgi:hypothetical protein